MSFSCVISSNISSQFLSLAHTRRDSQAGGRETGQQKHRLCSNARGRRRSLRVLQNRFCDIRALRPTDTVSNDTWPHREEPLKPPSRGIHSEKLLKVPPWPKVVRILITEATASQSTRVRPVNVKLDGSLTCEHEEHLPAPQNRDSNEDRDRQNECEDDRRTRSLALPRLVKVRRDPQRLKRHNG